MALCLLVSNRQDAGKIGPAAKPGRYPDERLRERRKSQVSHSITLSLVYVVLLEGIHQQWKTGLSFTNRFHYGWRRIRIICSNTPTGLKG